MVCGFIGDTASISLTNNILCSNSEIYGVTQIWEGIFSFLSSDTVAGQVIANFVCNIWLYVGEVQCEWGIPK